MQVEKLSVKNGSCNFCKRGQHVIKAGRFEYPYDYVYELSSIGGGLVTMICDTCIGQLIENVEYYRKEPNETL